MTDKTDSKEREALRSIGEEQAFEAWFKVDCPVEGANAKIAAKAAWKARASLSANAGEPMAYLIDWPDEPELGHYFSEFPSDSGRCRPLYLAAPPTAQAEGWTKASEQLPPCRDDQLYIGVNSAGYAGVFNAIASIAGNVHCMYETPEETIDVMGDLSIWKPFTPPTSAEGVGHG